MLLGTRWISYGDILKLKGVEEMVEVYYNSSQFIRTVSAMERLFPDAFSMYEALADFYHERGYQGISHTRIRRYEILLEYLEERHIHCPSVSISVSPAPPYSSSKCYHHQTPLSHSLNNNR
ncbi:DUF4080 domain-containing protein [Bacillus velezensis]|uniref:DUF4080 domain-containing protein n=1 Tax=Bacillus velezensis TaxID=492670 RepID=UPI003C6C39EB